MALVNLLCIGLLEDNPILAAISLGLCISSRQTALIFIPMVAAYWLIHFRLKQTCKYLLISGVVFLGLSLPFILRDPYQFLVAPIIHYQNLANYDLSVDKSRFIIDTIGFAYFIQTHWGVPILSPS